jgi:tetratricopeptide (TPR) repeat protein/GTPase SAR1 family protein
MQQETIEQKSRQLIARFIAEIKGAKAQGRQDNSVISEDAWIPILKVLYNCPDLQNMNNEKFNFPAIDLGDLKQGVAFQVTSQIKQEKVTHTLKQFKQHNLSNNFTKLFVFMLTERKKQYSQVRCDEVLKSNISFDVTKNIFDPYDLLKIISAKPLDDQLAVLNHLQVMMDDPVSILTNKGQAEEVKKSIFRDRAMWSHETTNDERYVNRTKYLSQLTRWANDSSVRTIAVSGMGGLGKTSMIGYWLKEKSDDISRSVEGLFFWSFYVKRDVTEFIKALSQYLETISDIELAEQYNHKSSQSAANNQPMDTSDALDVLMRKFHQLPPIIIVLDGLEVLQEAAQEGASYGAFIDAMLRDFILHVTNAEKPWLCVTTSRFPLADIAAKKQLETLDIGGVTEQEGASILHRRQVYGDQRERESISSFYDGHPFALLIFAASVPDTLRDSPIVHFNNITEGLNNNLFGEKLGRLMLYYKDRINPIQLQLISALSMFRSPVVPRTIINLTKHFIEPSKLTLDLNEDTSIDVEATKELFLLTSLGIIICDNIDGNRVYGCHPILREFFSNDALSNNRNMGLVVASFLINQPDSAGIIGVSNVEKYKVSIEALLKSGDLRFAEQLYRDRLEQGGIFIKLGIPKEAKQVYQHFIDFYSKGSNQQQNKFSSYVINNYINPYIEFCIQLAEYERAKSLLKQSIRAKNQAVSHRWIGRIHFSQGNYTLAIEECLKAIELDSSHVTAGSGKADSLAISYYYLISSLLAQGLVTRANTELKQLDLYKPYFETEYADSEAVPLLCKLMIAIRCENKELIRRVFHKCTSRLNKIANAFFMDEFKLVIIEAHLLRGAYEDASRLAKELYNKSVKESLPYVMSRAGLLLERAKQMDGSLLNQVKIGEMIDIAKSNRMWPIVVEGLLLAASSVDEDLRRQEYKDQANAIANRQGFNISAFIDQESNFSL